MSNATRDYALRRIEWLAEKLDRNDAARLWQTRLRDAAGVSVKTTLKDWMHAHAGQAIETLQATLVLSGADVVDARNIWAPGMRVVEPKATYTLLGVSRRDYAGTVATASSTDSWIGFEKIDDHAIQLLCYVVADVAAVAR